MKWLISGWWCHHALSFFNRPSSQPVINLPHNMACRPMYGLRISTRPTFAVSSLCPVSFSSAGHTATPVQNTGHPVSADPYRPGVSRPVKSRSYRSNKEHSSLLLWMPSWLTLYTLNNTELSFLPCIYNLKIFSGVIPSPPTEAIGFLDPDVTFRLARQRSHCSDFTKPSVTCSV